MTKDIDQLARFTTVGDLRAAVASLTDTASVHFTIDGKLANFVISTSVVGCATLIELRTVEPSVKLVSIRQDLSRVHELYSTADVDAIVSNAAIQYVHIEK